MESVESLSALSRKDLQALAKTHGLKANKKSAALVEELAVILCTQIAAESDHPPASASDGGVSGSSCLSPEDKSAHATPSPSTDVSRQDSKQSPATLPIDRLSPIVPNIQSPLPQESIGQSPLRADESLDIDDSVTSFQERSIRNLTMNIDTYGRISISSPALETAPAAAEQVAEDTTLVVDVTNNAGMKKARKSEVKTPAKAHPVLIPKSNKAQRLRREALEKKKERLDILAAKDKSSSSRSTLNVQRRSSQLQVAKAAAPARPVARVSLHPAPRPFGAATTSTTPVKPFKPTYVLSARKMDTSDKQSVFVDNEISFNIGSTKTPVKSHCGASTPSKNNNNIKGKSSKRVPDFKKMHSTQFSAQKSIVHKVVRDSKVVNNMDKAMKLALSAPISQENKENKSNAKLTAKAAPHMKGKRVSTVAGVSEMKQKQKLQASKSKREALQFRSRC